MPVVYIPGDGTYYVSEDVRGNPVKTKIGGIDPTQEPGYVRQSASTNTSSSSSVNQSLADPAQIAIQQQQVEIERQKATNDYNIAIRNGDQSAAEYAQTRLDNLAKQSQDLQYQYAALAQQASEGAANRGLTSSEGAANRGLTAQEGGLNREQAAQLAAINNALSASQFASTYGLSVKEQQQKQQEDALAAAKQFADLISSTDTAALPAFYKAGGGVIANALAGGKDALSDNALLPAARTLRAIANPVDYSSLSYNPTLYQPSQFMPQPTTSYAQQVAAPAAAVPATPAAPTTYRADSTPGYTTTPGGGVNLNAGEIAAGAQWAPTPGFAYGTGGGPIMRYMGGGADVPVGGQTSFISGDSTAPNPAAGGAHPEAVSINDPTHDATFSVNPLTQPGVGDTDGDNDSGSLGSLLIALGNFLDAQEDKQAGPIAGPMQSMMGSPGGMDGGMPRFALGTVPDPSGIAPEDLTFLDQVRQLRQGVDTTAPIAGGYFNVGYGNLAPSLRDSYAQSLQTRFGVPVADVNAEANRFQIPGVSMNDFTSGYGGGAKQDI